MFKRGRDDLYKRVRNVEKTSVFNTVLDTTRCKGLKLHISAKWDVKC